MNDKNFERFLFIVFMLFIAWWILHKRYAAQITTPDGGYIPSGNPELDTYAANPGAFGPQTVNGSVTINVDGYNGLNQNYMALFGFVGMAQGETYQ